MNNRFLSFFVFLVIVFGLYLISSFGSSLAPADWYVKLRPPSWHGYYSFFAFFWLFMYFLVALAGWLIWEDEEGRNAKLPLILYGTQLILYTLWHWIFFPLQNTQAAFFVITISWILSFFNISIFCKYKRIAGVLLIPLFFWVTYIAILNCFIMVFDTY